VAQQVHDFPVKTRFVRDGHTGPDLFQKRFFIDEILHEGAMEDDVPPGGRLQDVLSAPGHQGPAAIHNGRQAVGLEEFADDVDQNNPFIPPFFAAVDLPHGDEVGKTRFTDEGHDPVPPLDMAGNQNKLQIGMAFQQAPVNMEDDRFLPLVGTAGHPDFFVPRKIEPGPDFLLQVRRCRRREPVVFGVSLNMDLFRGHTHGDNAVPVRLRDDPRLVEPFQERLPEEPRPVIPPE